MLLCPTSSIQNKVFPCCSAVSVDFLLLSMEIMFMVLFAVFRCNFLLNNVIEKILLLTRRAERYLVVGAVRFVRTILSRHVSYIVLIVIDWVCMLGEPNVLDCWFPLVKEFELVIIT